MRGQPERGIQSDRTMSQSPPMQAARDGEQGEDLGVPPERSTPERIRSRAHDRSRRGTREPIRLESYGSGDLLRSATASASRMVGKELAGNAPGPGPGLIPRLASSPAATATSGPAGRGRQGQGGETNDPAQRAEPVDRPQGASAPTIDDAEPMGTARSMSPRGSGRRSRNRVTVTQVTSNIGQDRTRITAAPWEANRRIWSPLPTATPPPP